MAKKISEHFDALIVGGGIIGMLTARNLIYEGQNVALIEKDQLGGKASWAAGGILSPLNPWQLNKITQPLIDEGRDHFPTLADELKQETAIDVELLQSGMLVLDMHEKQQALEWAKEKNERVEILNNQDLHKLEPQLSKENREALYIPSIQQVRPPKLIAALKKYLQQKNLKLYENTCIEKILVEATSVMGVATKTNRFLADKVIICNGAWANSLFAIDSKVDIQPVRGQMLLYKPPKNMLARIILKENSYIIPRQDGHILCGSTIEHVGFKNEITQTAKLSLQNIANELLPELNNHAPVKQWSALRPGTRRAVPYICKHPRIEGLYLHSGHYRYGIVMGIASARVMVSLITKSLNASQIAAYS